MKFLITGHTGFKGAWLAALLKMQGHEVHGVALRPESQSLFNQAKIQKYLSSNHYLDIRHLDELRVLLETIQPNVVIHLAAQPLVRQSYIDPIGTYETNVIGTLNLLEATRRLQGLLAIQVITTDKVYKNFSQFSGYIETDELGGDDPYSSSKAAADIATQSWRKSFGTAPISISRAGNVIGGGDYARDRIIPDLVKSLSSNSPLIVRNPQSIRPWQHVLDCLNGYLKLVEGQIEFNFEGEWNFGPTADQIKSVSELVSAFIHNWGTPLNIQNVESNLPESEVLLLDSSKSRMRLAWLEKLPWDDSIKWTVDWYQAKDKEKITAQQVESFLQYEV